MGISLKPSEATQGGLLDNVNAEVKECSFVLYDYNGKVPTPNPALRMLLKDADTGEEYEQYWSIGNSKDWVPSENGKELVPVGSASSLKTNSNGMVFLTSLVNAGFPEDKIGDNVGVFEGMVAHFIRVAAPKRTGLEKQKRDDGKDFEATILTVDQITKLPWEKAKAAGAPGGAKAGAGAGAGAKAGTSTTTTATSSPDLAAKAQELVMQVLSENPDGITRKDLPTKIFQKVGSDPDRNAIVTLVFKEEFLSNGPWAYADGKVSLG